jgi:phosphoribosylformylglycinamidine synthase
VLGICNGFQVLLEAGLLPGVLLRNSSLRFVCRYIRLRVENVATRFTNRCAPGEVIALPVAHGEGNYFTDAATLQRLEGEGRIIFRYCDASGATSPEANPNGSLAGVAGIINETGNVLGMMPHPERAVDPVLRNTHGQKLFASVIGSFLSGEPALVSAHAGPDAVPR